MAAGAKHAGHFAKRDTVPLEVLDHAGGTDQVENAVGEGKMLDAATAESCRLSPQPGPRALEHATRGIKAADAKAPPRQRVQQVPRPAARVENSGAGGKAERVDEF